MENTTPSIILAKTLPMLSTSKPGQAHNQNSKKSTKLRQLSSSLAVILFIGVSLGFVYHYGVRERLEGALFDLRTTLLPDHSQPSSVLVVAVDDQDLQPKHSSQKTRSIAEDPIVLSTSRQLLNRGAGHLVAVLPHQDYDYGADRFAPFIDLLKKHPNLSLGVFDHHKSYPSEVTLPLNLREYQQRVLGAATARSYRYEVVRRLPLFYYHGSSLSPAVWLQVASLYSSKAARLASHSRHLWAEHKSAATLHKLPSFLLKYRKPNKLRIWSSSEIESLSSKELRSSIVILGYHAFRRRSVRFQEGSHVKTPYDPQSFDERQGTPLIHVIATALDNLLTEQWLHEAPFYINVVQTFLFSLSSLLIWALPTPLASILFVILLSLMLITHVSLWHLSSTYIPLADTVIFSALATSFGAFLRSHVSTRQRSWEQMQLRRFDIESKYHSQVLTTLARDLGQSQRVLTRLLSQIKHPPSNNKTLVRIYQHFRNALDELAEYLAGIQIYTQSIIKDDSSPKRRLFSASAIVDKVIGQFADKIADNKLEVKHLSSFKQRIISDPYLFELIIFNLVSNAIKYSPPKSQITIRSSLKKNQLNLKVTDLGPGIALDQQEAIFQRFYRIQNDQFHTVKGNGLGLFLCRYFAQKLAGEISVKSELGKGATFSLRLTVGTEHSATEDTLD